LHVTTPEFELGGVKPNGDTFMVTKSFVAVSQVAGTRSIGWTAIVDPDACPIVGTELASAVWTPA